MNTTPSPAIEAVELPEPDAFQALKLVPFEYRWFHVRENATKLGYDIEKVFYSDETVRALLAAKQEEVDKMTEHLRFVERWANHHGQKPHTTPQEALSVIQHYPPILAITRSYADGKVPETPNPYVELDKMRVQLSDEKTAFYQGYGAAHDDINNGCAPVPQIAWDRRAALSPTQGA